MEKIDIELDADDVRRAVTRSLPYSRSLLWMRYNEVERTLAISFATLVRLYDLLKDREGVIRVRMTFNPQSGNKVPSYGFEIRD